MKKVEFLKELMDLELESVNLKEFVINELLEYCENSQEEATEVYVLMVLDRMIQVQKKNLRGRSYSIYEENKFNIKGSIDTSDCLELIESIKLLEGLYKSCKSYNDSLCKDVLKRLCSGE